MKIKLIFTTFLLIFILTGAMRIDTDNNVISMEEDIVTGEELEPLIGMPPTVETITVYIEYESDASVE